MSNLKTNIFIVLDSSGSMKDIKKETIFNLNKQISIAKASSSKIDSNISLFTVNENVKEVFFNVPINDVKSINGKDYKPQGMTSVIDGISYALNKAESISDNDTSFLFIIISDGKDNSSDSSIKDLSKRIGKFQDKGNWTFTYIGANHDLGSVCKSLNIPKGNTLKYESNSLGVITMTETQAKSLGYFFTARSYGTTGTRGFYGSDN